MSAGLPSWKRLIEHLVEELELAPGSPAAESGYPVLAEYFRLKKGGLSPLRSWMDRHWRVAEEAVRNSRLHEIVVSLEFPIIYTTNYDSNLEAAFRVHGRDYLKVANAGDVTNATADVTQIVKFHGDFEDEQSLVITETDYFNRLDFDTPLDIKFRADALGRTVLFVGYSVSDINIRLLLYRLWQTWRASGQEAERPQSFVFMPHQDPVQEAVLAQWGIGLLTEEAEDPEQALLTFLLRLRQRVEGLRGQRGSTAPREAG